MDHRTLNHFKKLFQSQRDQLLDQKIMKDQELELSRDDLPDEADTTSREMHQAMRVRLQNRESLLLKKIDSALDRIREGSFGLCQGCEESIEVKRLEARPTTTLCVACKEDQERKERTFGEKVQRGQTLASVYG